MNDMELKVNSKKMAPAFTIPIFGWYIKDRKNVSHNTLSKWCSAKQKRVLEGKRGKKFLMRKKTLTPDWTGTCWKVQRKDKSANLEEICDKRTLLILVLKALMFRQKRKKTILSIHHKNNCLSEKHIKSTKYENVVTDLW